MNVLEMVCHDSLIISFLLTNASDSASHDRHDATSATDFTNTSEEKEKLGSHTTICIINTPRRLSVSRCNIGIQYLFPLGSYFEREKTNAKCRMMLACVQHFRHWSTNY